MSNNTEPSQVQLRKKRTSTAYADLLGLAKQGGGGTDRQDMSAKALSAAEWTGELEWADRMAAQHGWNDDQTEVLIERLKVRHVDKWGTYAVVD